MEVESRDVAADLPAFDVRGLLRDERDSLLGVLTGLDADSWRTPTMLPGWTVHHVALHLLGNDLGRLSAWRDGWRTTFLHEAFEDLAAAIEAANEAWVRGAGRISPPLLVEFLSTIGRQLDDHLATVDLSADGTPVAWTGTGPSPVWLDLAREYTERWVHHQQIREAVALPILAERRFLHPVLDTFMRALPRAYAGVAAAEATTVVVDVVGDGGGRWAVRRGPMRWQLVDPPDRADATVRMPQDMAWRLLTRLVSVDEGDPAIETLGPRELVEPAARAVAVMTTKV